MQPTPPEAPPGNVKGVLGVLGLCLALGALLTYLQGQWGTPPSNSPDCSDDIVVAYEPEARDAPPSIFVKSIDTVFEIPRDSVLHRFQGLDLPLEAGRSAQFKYQEVLCDHDVSTLYLGEKGEQPLRFDVRAGGGSAEVKTRQDEKTGAWYLKIVAPPPGAAAR